MFPQKFSSSIADILALSDYRHPRQEPGYVVPQMVGGGITPEAVPDIVEVSTKSPSGRAIFVACHEGDLVKKLRELRIRPVKV